MRQVNLVTNKGEQSSFLDDTRKPTMVCASKFLDLGLTYAGCQGWNMNNRKRREARFVNFYGTSLEAAVALFDDLRAEDDKVNPVYLLMSLRFLSKYMTEMELATEFRYKNEKTARKWAKLYLTKIRGLKGKKIDIYWDDIEDDLVIILTVDGTHCPMEEMRPFSTKNSSYKFGGKCGVMYEIAVWINKDKIAWVNGPYPPTEQDLPVFQNRGLRDRIDALGPDKRLLGDEGYVGEPDYISTKNVFDPAEIRQFKNRALARHENVNLRFKRFKCLTQKWRHGLEEHKAAFEAIAVIVQTEMDLSDKPLLDPYP